MSRWLLYLGQGVVFAVHGLLALAYHVLMFFSKRGSLLIMPILVALAAVQFHEPVRDGVRVFLFEFRPDHVPSPAALDGILAILLALTLLLHRLLARMLSIRRYLLVPVMLALALVLFRASAHDELKLLLLPYPLRQMPGLITLDVILVVLLILAMVLYMPLSHMLSVVLGTFPSLNWPLRPIRPLRVTTRRIIAVAVRQMVPRLPKRRWKLQLQTRKMNQA
jgi:hypothetical protein